MKKKITKKEKEKLELKGQFRKDRFEVAETQQFEIIGQLESWNKETKDFYNKMIEYNKDSEIFNYSVNLRIYNAFCLYDESLKLYKKIISGEEDNINNALKLYNQMVKNFDNILSDLKIQNITKQEEYENKELKELLDE